MLDAVAPDVPVVLIAGDGHHAWLNTRALERLGLPDARRGGPRERVVRRLHPASTSSVEPDVSPAAYRRTLDAAAALGITGIVDLERGQLPADWETARAARSAVRVATYADGLDAPSTRACAPATRSPARRSWITMGPLKIISDGSLNTRTAWCCEEYADGGSGPGGRPTRPAPSCAACSTRAHGTGSRWRPTRSVTSPSRGARGVRRTGARRLDRARPAGPPRATYAAMARLGLRASVQPAHLLDDRDVTELSSGRTGPSAASRSAGCSTTASRSRWAPTRRSRRSTRGWRSRPPSTAAPTSAPPWHPEQALTAREALAASVDGQRQRPCRACRPTSCCSTPTRWPPTRPRRGRRPALRADAGRATWSTATLHGGYSALEQLGRVPRSTARLARS